MKDFDNIKVTVIGAARSGIAAAQLFKSHGASVFVSEQNSTNQVITALESLQSSGIGIEYGGHTDRVFDCAFMIISPGVPSNSPVVIEAQRRRIKVVSEIEAASWFCLAPIVAVTGSNGKTTTTTLIGEIFKEAKLDNEVAGNIGTAFSGVVNSLTLNSTAILEVSSFQLDHVEMFHPKVSVLLNITPDHLDRYDNSMDKYSASKARIFSNQTNDDVLIYNIDDEIVKNIVKSAICKLLPFSIKQMLIEGGYLVTNENGKQRLVIRINDEELPLVEIQEMNIKGLHNIYNSLAAALAANVMGIQAKTISQALKQFKGVEHRLEFVRVLNGVKYINDSKATNVDSVWYALNAVSEPIILLLGGRDKGNDYSKLTELIQEKVKAIVAIGESAEKVYDELSRYKTVQIVTSMAEAVKAAAKFAVTGDVVLLSPACASFDWFDNYEHRGKVFKELVNKL
ncbi:MAG: UDP-N-acetylmuramoyl-L-alanine--D-glutamate ligase [Bacteroidota bacterium]|nr:UDP-N-acetylmuramoyl-L-alanine--D-glutamate ligase [Bacteroidota bacterium]